MMPLPRGPGRKLDIVKILEASPGAYEVWPRSPLRNDEEFANLVERLRACTADGDALSSTEKPRTLLLTTGDVEGFKKRLMSKGIAHE